MSARHLFNFEAFALFVYMRTEQPKHLTLTEAAEEAGVTKAQLFRAIHKQPVNNGAFISLCIWMGINPHAFVLDAATMRGLAPLPDGGVPPHPERATSTETGSAPDLRKRHAA